MQDVSSEGKTVFFVSHNMPAVTRLCDRTIMLSNGRLVADGPSHETVAYYMHEGHGSSSERSWDDPNLAPGGEVSRLRRVRIRNEQGTTVDSIDIRKTVGLEMTFEVIQAGYMLLPHFHLVNEDGVTAFTTIDSDSEWRRKRRPKGTYTLTAWIPGNFLSEGNFFVNAAVLTIEPQTTQFYERDTVGFNVVDSMDGDSARGDWAKNIPGIVRPLLKWETEYTHWRPRSARCSGIFSRRPG